MIFLLSLMPSAVFLVCCGLVLLVGNHMAASYTLAGFYLLNLGLAAVIVFLSLFYFTSYRILPKNIAGAFLGSVLLLAVYLLAYFDCLGTFSVVIANQFLLFCILFLLSLASGLFHLCRRK